MLDFGFKSRVGIYPITATSNTKRTSLTNSVSLPLAYHNRAHYLQQTSIHSIVRCRVKWHKQLQVGVRIAIYR